MRTFWFDASEEEGPELCVHQGNHLIYTKWMAMKKPCNLKSFLTIRILERSVAQEMGNEAKPIVWGNSVTSIESWPQLKKCFRDVIIAEPFFAETGQYLLMSALSSALS
ncbi:uncharacterized protein N7483_006494 [Penicillium malachiteum]|uniref:uncharacterized protein n=1 Tax=Penicillium malachiteum TaxID=1324776 RepID=UPI002547F8FD|nr:uncharacterized protein N7483_006494 [Penicillium malachiteum]KAJ5725137.1 hypothetical protein N7483_006494 [Penicillium malachiteum]